MNKHIVNLTFKNQEELKKWEEENLKNNEYKGQKIFMVMHDQCIGNDEIKITEIWTV